MDQRREIVERFDRTGSLREAFKTVQFSKVQLSDLTFDTVGSRRIR